MTKFYDNAVLSISSIIKDGMTIMAGGFGLCGIPENLIEAISKINVRNLTVISNNCGVDDFGLGILLKNGQISKMISSYVGENKVFENLVLENKIEIELVPQGTLAERIRAGGAGIPAFYTPTGFGTVVAKDKEVKEFDGKKYILEKSLKADIAIIKAHKSDKFGNVVYNKTARNFNSVMASAAKVCFCEVEEIVDELDPNNVHTPFVYIDHLIKGSNYKKRIEKLTLSN